MSAADGAGGGATAGHGAGDADDGTERLVHGLRIAIDRGLCVGFGDCVEAAAEAFRLDDTDVVVFVAPERADRARLLRACDACPVDALTVWDADGRRLVP